MDFILSTVSWLVKTVIGNPLFSTVQNDIQIDLYAIPEPYQTFIHNTIAEANELGIKVFMSAERQVDLDISEKTTCNGYFCSDEKILATACGQDFTAWFSVFIHESSHMDQWRETDPTWVESSKLLAGVEVGMVLDLWLHEYVEANEKQLVNIISPSREVELNCERRTVEKIKKHNLPMDIEHYIKRANAYVHFYNMMAVSRKWYTIGKEPYNIPEILEVMPLTLDGDYSTTPPEIAEAYIKYMFK